MTVTACAADRTRPAPRRAVRRPPRLRRAARRGVPARRRSSSTSSGSESVAANREDDALTVALTVAGGRQPRRCAGPGPSPALLLTLGGVLGLVRHRRARSVRPRSARSSRRTPRRPRLPRDCPPGRGGRALAALVLTWFLDPVDLSREGRRHQRGGVRRGPAAGHRHPERRERAEAGARRGAAGGARAGARTPSGSGPPDRDPGAAADHPRAARRARPRDERDGRAGRRRGAPARHRRPRSGARPRWPRSSTPAARSMAEMRHLLGILREAARSRQVSPRGPAADPGRPRGPGRPGRRGRAADRRWRCTASRGGVPAGRRPGGVPDRAGGPHQLPQALAAATTPRCDLTYRPTEVDVEVTDDGRGHRWRRAGPGHGLPGMRERVAMYGGDLERRRPRRGRLPRPRHPPAGGVAP